MRYDKPRKSRTILDYRMREKPKRGVEWELKEECVSKEEKQEKL